MHGLPLFHVHGLVLGLLGSLRVGNRFVHTGKPTPAAYAEAAGTLYFGVPTVWSRIAADEQAARALAGRDCWCPAALRCRCRSSTSWCA